MIYLHKILPVFLMPTTIAGALMIAGLVFKRRSFCWIGLALAWAAATPIVSNKLMRAAEGWQTRAPISAVAKAGTIVVLSQGLVRAPGDPNATEWLDPDRFFAGVELFKAGKAPLLIFTGGWAPWRSTLLPEGEVLTEYAVNLGVPRKRVLVTPKVANTEEEGKAVADLLSKHPGANTSSPVLLVTSAHHMPRARLLFERAGLRVAPFPVDFKVSEKSLTPLDFLPAASSLMESEAALRELYGLAYYRLVKG